MGITLGIEEDEKKDTIVPEVATDYGTLTNVESNNEIEQDTFLNQYDKQIISSFMSGESHVKELSNSFLENKEQAGTWDYKTINMNGEDVMVVVVYDKNAEILHGKDETSKYIQKAYKNGTVGSASHGENAFTIDGVTTNYLLILFDEKLPSPETFHPGMMQELLFG